MALGDYASVGLNQAVKAEADLFVLATVDAGGQSGVRGTLIGMVGDDPDPENMAAVAAASAHSSDSNDAGIRTSSLTMPVQRGKWFMVRAIKDWGEPEFAARKVAANV
jgi:hypothetical protein